MRGRDLRVRGECAVRCGEWGRALACGLHVRGEREMRRRERSKTLPREREWARRAGGGGSR